MKPYNKKFQCKMSAYKHNSFINSPEANIIHRLQSVSRRLSLVKVEYFHELEARYYNVPAQSADYYKQMVLYCKSS